MLSRRLQLLSKQSRPRPVCPVTIARSPLRQQQQPRPRPFSSSIPWCRKKREREPVLDGPDDPDPPRFRMRRLEVKRVPVAIRKSATVKRVNARPAKPAASKDESEKPGDRGPAEQKSLREALLEQQEKHGGFDARFTGKKLAIETLKAEDLDFQPVDMGLPSVPMLSYGLDRVLFNPGVYRLQDPRSRVYNFDPYLEKIMQVTQFDFKALTPYKTSSKDEELLELTKRLGIKYTGSTSSMSGVLQHFHFLLSHARTLNHDMLSRSFPKPTHKFSKITAGPSAVFLRWKNGTYAMDADKAYDTPNIMSWLGHSMEKLLTTDQEEFERYRKSSPSKVSPEDDNRCFHYSKQGNFLMRSQLDAHDPRLPGTGVFDVKTRAVVSIRMNHEEYETGAGYQLRFDRGEWESFEREFYDMTRATMLKYSLQVRMGRMDGIFVAYHNIERIFGFQYLSLSDMDHVLHGQTDTCLGDQEFKFSVRLLDELLEKATAKFPEQTLRLHFHTRGERSPFMYIFAEPVTDEQADEIQSRCEKANKKFERDVIGIDHSEEELQEEWNEIQSKVDETVETETEQAESSKLESSETDSKHEEVDELETKVNDRAHQVKKAEEIEEVKEVEEVEEVEEGGSKGVTSELEDSDETLVDDVETPAPAASGPLIGWTLAIRNRVNGRYVDRPEDLKPDEDWSLEYHIKEIDHANAWSLYKKVKESRNKLIGEQRKEATNGLDVYREIIKRYSRKGRKWRDRQDVIDEQLGIRVYEPMGPGSPLYGVTKD